MQKPSRSERFSALILVLVTLLSTQVTAQVRPDSTQGSTLDVAIEAARQRKEAELRKELARRIEGPMALDPTPSLERPPPVIAPRAPRLWSLTARGTRVEAEIYFDHQIFQVDSSQVGATVGPWTVSSLDTDGVTLLRRSKAGGGIKREAERLRLVVSSADDYPDLISTTTRTELTGVSESAHRAAQLPFPSVADAPNHGRPVMEAKQAGVPQHGEYITSFQRLPAHAEVLTVLADVGRVDAANGQLPLTADKFTRLAVLGQAQRRFFVLSVPEELRSPTWYYLIDRGKSLGLIFSGFATASAEVIRLAHYGHALTDDLKQQRREEIVDQRVLEAIVAQSTPLEWFRSVVQRCLSIGSSDMHVELRGQAAVLRVRLDGIMRQVMDYPMQVALEGLSAAYTVLAEERSRTEVAFNRNVPQAATIPLEIGSQKLTLRYQSHPAVGGLDVVIRLLRSEGSTSRTTSLSSLGFTPWQAEQLQHALGSAWGGIFVAGITGSGKTTTLNSLLSTLARERTRKILTIEDPVEYVLDGVTHMSIQRPTETGSNKDPFHAAMLAFLRMDPDVGLFGEIRDGLSARMAQTAIQTGHKILSTVHATSALGIVSRLASDALGLRREDVCSPEFISAMIYQVLIPLNCEHCKRPATQVMSADELQTYSAGFGLNPATMYCASDDGCPHCRKNEIDYTGSLRIGISGVKVGAEVIVPDNRLLELLEEGHTIQARRHYRSLQEEGFRSANMAGKEAWGHVLYDISCGRVDPFYFSHTFGNPAVLAHSLKQHSSV